MSKKKHIYLIPGLAANISIFENLELDEKKFELHYITWIIPADKYESIEQYASRLIRLIKHTEPVLVGVSFGGIIAQEIAFQIKVEKLIIISSIKSIKEMPISFVIARKLKIARFIPQKLFSNLDYFLKYIPYINNQGRKELYKKHLSIKDPIYLKWAIYQLIFWNPKPNTIKPNHIHGTNDSVFPSKRIENFIPIENGTHAMIIFKAKSISMEIEHICNDY